jgi:hypothetical protein
VPVVSIFPRGLGGVTVTQVKTLDGCRDAVVRGHRVAHKASAAKAGSRKFQLHPTPHWQAHNCPPLCRFHLFL